jgi:hypothetical protein
MKKPQRKISNHKKIKIKTMRTKQCTKIIERNYLGTTLKKKNTITK